MAPPVGHARPDALFSRERARDQGRRPRAPGGHEGCSTGTVAICTLADWRSSLLVCDECDAVMARDGRIIPKRHRESDPDDLAPHYMPRADIEAAATAAGWTLEEEDEERWSCPPCSSKRVPMT